MTSTVKHRTHPCANCPYRKDAPLGLWHEGHYFDVLESEGAPIGVVFQCHKDGDKPKAERSMCAGYLLDQKKRGLPSVALRAEVSCDEAAHKAFTRVRSTVEMFESATTMAVANLKRILAERAAAIDPATVYCEVCGVTTVRHFHWPRRDKARDMTREKRKNRSKP